MKLITILCSLLIPVLSWGPIGHSSVAKIAQNLLTESASSNVANLLPQVNGNMSAVANWADEVRTLPQFHWSEPLHFINTPNWNCSYLRSRDCYNEQGQFPMCVDGAIQNYTQHLIMRRTTTQDDLKFLIHFVGDIHQPLHCGFKDDRGGNSIKVKWEGVHTNLHSVWDSAIIEHRLKLDFHGDPNGWINYIMNTYIQPYNSPTSSEEWGDESTGLACSHAYVLADGKTRIESGTVLDETYYYANIKIVETRIALAGMRLAYILNLVFK